MVEVIQEGDCEFAGGAQEIAKYCGGDIGVSLEILEQETFGGGGGGAAEVEVGCDFDDAALAFHRG